MIDVGMYKSFSFSLLLSLTVPVLGYTGAKRRNRQLLGCFTLCNGLVMCWWCIMIILCFVALAMSVKDLGGGYNFQHYVNEAM